MDRRTALKVIAVATIATPVSADFKSASKFGWMRDDISLLDFIHRHRNPYVTDCNEEIKGSGKGKIVFLHKAFERITGKAYVPHDQGAPDCVSQGFALGVDFLTAIQIVVERKAELWKGKAATEPIYGGSRIEVGGYDGYGGGSTGHWAAEWISRYGILLRQEYPGGYDFTNYSANKAKEYGRTGCPDPLEPLTKLHPVKKTAICTSYADMCDCIANGHPVVVCSNVGFGDSRRPIKRDSQGFLTRKRRPWKHCMLFGGFDDRASRKGALCFNSWGSKWVYGPTRHNQPTGTFWIDKSTVDSMLRQRDSFALSAYVGYPRVTIPYIIW
jgi:hypothetical protein